MKVLKDSLLLILACMALGALAKPSIAYHGKLTVTTGDVNVKMPIPIEFRLYRNGEPGETTALWGRRISVKLDGDGLFYVTLNDTAGTDTGRTQFKELSRAIASQKGGDIYISLTPSGYSELLPRKRLSGVYRSQYAEIASSAERIEAPVLKAESATVGRLDIVGDFSVTEKFISNGGKIVNTVDGKSSSASLGAQGGRVVFSGKFNCWNNLTSFTIRSNRTCADSLFGWAYSPKYGIFTIPHPIDSEIHSSENLVYSQQLFQGYYSPLW